MVSTCHHCPWVGLVPSPFLDGDVVLVFSTRQSKRGALFCAGEMGGLLGKFGWSD